MVIVCLFMVFILTSSHTATLSSMLTLQRIQFALVKDYIGIWYNLLLWGNIANNWNFKDDSLWIYQSPEEFIDLYQEEVKKVVLELSLTKSLPQNISSKVWCWLCHCCVQTHLRWFWLCKYMTLPSSFFLFFLYFLSITI